MSSLASLLLLVLLLLMVCKTPLVIMSPRVFPSPCICKPRFFGFPMSFLTFLVLLLTLSAAATYPASSSSGAAADIPSSGAFNSTTCVGSRSLFKLPDASSGTTMPGPEAADVVVATDGSGNCTTVGEAVAKAPGDAERRFIIYVKRGVYNEYLEINKTNVMLIGDGMDATIISGNRSVGDGWQTYGSATVGVSGSRFIARDLTIENTAGPSKHQAVALRSDSDSSVYYKCAFKGYQDTLYARSGHQFYRDCVISGTVDFIFGNAAAVFQYCQIRARVALPNQKNTITAHGRLTSTDDTGFSFQLCNITADEDLAKNISQTFTYLGRPWGNYSRTIFMDSDLGALIRPEGWLEWDGQPAPDTLYYAEYMNRGDGANTTSRVKWLGYHNLTSSEEAANFTVARFIDGDSWLPSTGVAYRAGL